MLTAVLCYGSGRANINNSAFYKLCAGKTVWCFKSATMQSRKTFCIFPEPI